MQWATAHTSSLYYCNNLAITIPIYYIFDYYEWLITFIGLEKFAHTLRLSDSKLKLVQGWDSTKWCAPLYHVDGTRTIQKRY